jgi:hypothetical protein
LWCKQGKSIFCNTRPALRAILRHFGGVFLYLTRIFAKAGAVNPPAETQRSCLLKESNTPRTANARTHRIAAAGDLSPDTKNLAHSLTLATCALSSQAKTARGASSSVAERKYDGHGTKSVLPALALEFCNFRTSQGSSLVSKKLLF